MIKFEVGLNVAVFADKVTAPATPTVSVLLYKVILVLVIVAASIASENDTVILSVIAISVAKFVGLLPVIVGAITSALIVVKDEVKFEAIALPTESVTPVVAVKV